MTAVANPGALGFTLTLPGTDSPLRRSGPRILLDGSERRVGVVRDGVWDLLGDGEGLPRWSEAYAAVRNAEGRRSASPEYYRRLPYEDLSGAFPDQWRVRSRSFIGLVEDVLDPMAGPGHPLRILDAGAGNCWMAARLSGMGHHTVALDVNIDPGDGLAAHVNHPEDFVAVRAPMDLLPLPTGGVDVVVFGASLHYVYRRDAPDGGRVLAEARRVLAPGGRIVVVDSPLFDDAGSGERMVVEQQGALRERLGVEPPGITGDGFLHRPSLLTHLREVTGGTLRVVETHPGTPPRPRVRSLVRGLVGRSGRPRERARFATIVATVATVDDRVPPSPPGTSPAESGGVP